MAGSVYSLSKQRTKTLQEMNGLPKSKIVSSSLYSSTMKRSRASYQNAQSPRCQVEGCNLDLTSAKDYHRRHRICDSHSKSPKVIVSGLERRFCQQCSRFHGLFEFDDKKRSCRRRLSDHNARRRRPHAEDVHFGSANLSTIERRPQMNFLVNKVPIRVTNPGWEKACNFKVKVTGDSLLCRGSGVAIEGKPYFPSSMMSNYISSPCHDLDRPFFVEGATPLFIDHGPHATAIPSNSLAAPDLLRAFSLLSTNSWGSNELQPALLDPFFKGNFISFPEPVMQPEGHKWETASYDFVRAEQAPLHNRLHELNLQTADSIWFQDFQDNKIHSESECFYSSQID